MDAVTITGSSLLVPGAAGRADVLREFRSAVLAALHRLVDEARDTICVLAQGPAPRQGTLRASLAALGIDDRHLGWQDKGSGADVAGASASIAVLALRAAGWRGPIEVIESPVLEPDLDVLMRRAGTREPAVVVVVDTAEHVPSASGRWSTRLATFGDGAGAHHVVAEHRHQIEVGHP